MQQASARWLAVVGVALLLIACGQPAAPAPSLAAATERPGEVPSVPPTVEPTVAPATAGPASAPAPQGAASPPYELTLVPATVAVGEQLVATVIRRSIAQGDCRFLAYDMTLRDTSDTPHFSFDSPERLGPPAPSTGVYTLTASLAGDATLVADIYGETDCGGGFSWATQHSNLVQITVGAPRQAYLPRILRQPAGAFAMGKETR